MKSGSKLGELNLYFLNLDQKTLADMIWKVNIHQALYKGITIPDQTYYGPVILDRRKIGWDILLFPKKIKMIKTSEYYIGVVRSSANFKSDSLDLNYAIHSEVVNKLIEI